MEIDDPFQELGLTVEASDADVKAAWRRLSARWHPDRNSSPQALQRIQRINRALDDIQSAREQKPVSEPKPSSPAPQAQREPIEHTISLSLEEAASGCIRSVFGEIARECCICAGSGKAPEPQTCADCGGDGHVRQNLWFQWFPASARCGACEGRGSRQVTCSCCEGKGHLAPLSFRSRLRIPAGMRDGQLLHASVKLKGGNGDQPLDIRINVQPHAFLQLQDDGIIRLQIPVDGFAWVAGRWIEVPTLYGMRRMRLQRGALTYRMSEAGFPVTPSGAPADCLVTVIPLFPEHWSERQQEMLDALIQTNTEDEMTEAGTRIQAWNKTLGTWRKSHGSTAES